MSKEVKNNVLTNVITSLAIGVMSAFGVWFANELETYKEMKAALPEIKEINKIREEMELEYKTNKQKVASDIWRLKTDLKEVKANCDNTLVNKKLSKILKTQERDSSYIFYNYYKIESLTDGR